MKKLREQAHWPGSNRPARLFSPGGSRAGGAVIAAVNAGGAMVWFGADGAAESVLWVVEK